MMYLDRINGVGTNFMMMISHANFSFLIFQVDESGLLIKNHPYIYMIIVSDPAFMQIHVMLRSDRNAASPRKNTGIHTSA